MNLRYATLLALAITAAAQAQTITTSGFTFSPNLLTVQAGATITATIGGGHTMTQVSEATWNANGNTPLSGGFNYGSGTHQLNLTVPGTYYYVCAPHAGSGMKGRIVVEVNTGLAEQERPTLLLYPNPANEAITVSGALAGRDTAVLFDLEGREALRAAVPANGQLAVADVRAGTYVLHLLDAEGRSALRQRVVIAH